MEEFIQSWNANAHVNVSWGKKKIGGSVDVDVKYSGGVENAKSKYFHSISFYNQEFYIVMQSDLSTYKSILNEGFINDLYSDMEPAVFFDRYGTHFITSAVMRVRCEHRGGGAGGVRNYERDVLAVLVFDSGGDTGRTEPFCGAYPAFNDFNSVHISDP